MDYKAILRLTRKYIQDCELKCNEINRILTDLSGWAKINAMRELDGLYDTIIRCRRNIVSYRQQYKLEEEK